MSIEVVDVEIEKLKARYEAAMHAVQSGVAIDLEINPKTIEAKHLRVGVNSALIDSSAMARLLMKKGIITEREYLESVVEFAEKEQADYEAKLTAHFGKTIKLG